MAKQKDAVAGLEPKLKQEACEKERQGLQAELCHLQQWVKHNGKRITETARSERAQLMLNKGTFIHNAPATRDPMLEMQEANFDFVRQPLKLSLCHKTKIARQPDHERHFAWAQKSWFLVISCAAPNLDIFGSSASWSIGSRVSQRAVLMTVPQK